MNVSRMKSPTIVLAAVALVIGVGGGAVGATLITGADVKDGSLTGADLKEASVNASRLQKLTIGEGRLKDGAVTAPKIANNSVTSGRIKDGAVGTNDLANGSVTANKLAPGAVAFPQTLWGPMLRNQSGPAQSTLVTGPTGQPMGTGSLQLSTENDLAVAAFGDSIDAAGIQLADIKNLSYWTFTSSGAVTAMPRLNIEINPHLVADTAPRGVFEFTTLVHQPVGGTGWIEHTGLLTDPHWYLTGQEGIDIGCTQDTPCTFNAILADLNASPDADTEPPAISSGVYFGLGSGAPNSTSNVDKFVFNNFTFDFEPSGVFLTTS